MGTRRAKLVGFHVNRMRNVIFITKSNWCLAYARLARKIIFIVAVRLKYT